MLMLGLGEKGGVVKREKEKLKREASRYRLWTVGEKEEGHYLSLTHVMYQLNEREKSCGVIQDMILWIMMIDFRSSY